jgi:hypothetical protein
MTTSVQVPGGARLWFDEAREPVLRFALGHGAGGGPEAPDLDALARRLPDAGISVVRVEQPWRVAGKRIAPRPEVLDRSWRAALESVDRRVPLALGGRSAGARVACRTAGMLGAVAVVALAFPLHPPGRPERSRLPELTAVEVPVLVVQGERDAFGRPEEFPAGRHRVVAVPFADHGMKVTRAHDAAAALDCVVRAVRDFLRPFGESSRTRGR